MAEHRKRILHNFLSLSLVQGVSILFPLISFPYLLRVLGIENFGVFTLLQTLVMYFDLLISFGFGLTATKYISRSIKDVNRTQEVITAVYTIKLLLFSLTIVLLFTSCLFFSYLRDNIFLVFMSLLYLLGNLLFPDWYFQGIQKMRNIAFVAFIARFLGLLLIILLVKKETDIGYAMLSVALGNFIAGAFGFFLLQKFVKLKVKMPRRRFVISLFKEAWYVFAVAILAPMYSSVNIFILQAFTNPLTVGYYAVAEKIFSAIGMITSLANRTLYPHLTQLYATSKRDYSRNVKKILLLFLGGFGLLALVQFFTAEQIIRLISGSKDFADVSPSVVILQIMSIGQLFSPFVSFCFQLLIIQGQRGEAIRNISIGVLVNLLSACILAYYLAGTGMALNLSIVVFLIALLNYLSFRRKLQVQLINRSAL